jgi:hypothetical protein
MDGIDIWSMTQNAGRSATAEKARAALCTAAKTCVGEAARQLTALVAPAAAGNMSEVAMLSTTHEGATAQGSSASMALAETPLWRRAPHPIYAARLFVPVTTKTDLPSELTATCETPLGGPASDLKIRNRTPEDRLSTATLPLALPSTSMLRWPSMARIAVTRVTATRVALSSHTIAPLLRLRPPRWEPSPPSSSVGTPITHRSKSSASSFDTKAPR